MREPAAIVDDLEHHAPLPPGAEERFLGYGITGLPFQTGHVLALRRFPASSIGPGYRLVWHRDPGGRWTFYQDQPAELACTRYFGSDVDDVCEGPVQIEWIGPRKLRVGAGDGELEWIVNLGSTIATHLFNGVGSALPGRAWRSRPFLQVMSRMAGVALRAGRIRLTGLTPNGQRFVANPSTMWIATASGAILKGVDLGAMGPIPHQAHLRDFALPQRGMFVVGRPYFSQDEREPQQDRRAAERYRSRRLLVEGRGSLARDAAVAAPGRRRRTLLAGKASVSARAPESGGHGDVDRGHAGRQSVKPQSGGR